MTTSNDLLEETNNTLTDDALNNDSEIITEGFVGGVESSPEVLGIENVEGYDYEAMLAESSLETDEVQNEIEEETEILEEESFPEAWFASYERKQDEAVLTEVLDESNADGAPQESVQGRDDRVRINGTTKYPWRAICSLIMTSRTGKKFIGTGWLVGPRTVITAGHCVYFHNEGGWAKSIQVIPGRNGGRRPYGSCKATSFRSVTGWTRNKNRNTDYGAIILPSNCRFGDRVGYFGYAYKNDTNLMRLTLNISGYPGDKPSGTQWFHSKRPARVTPNTINYTIDTAGGQSGSPVWYISNGKRYAIGIHTNGGSFSNSATRIIKSVFNLITKWKKDGQ